MKYWNYTTDDIVEKKMYPLIPLQLFTLRKELKRLESKNDQQAIKEVSKEAKELAKQLAEKSSELFSKQEFYGEDFHKLLLGIQNLIEYLNRVYFKDESIEKDVVTMTKTLYDPEVEKNFIEDKFSRLDIKATTNKGEKINIEIQLRNEKNMIKRTLYYWSKMYEEQLSEGRNYSSLNRTVCINILNFDYLENNKFHSMFRLKDVDTDKELTDVMEIHFIEIPKLADDSEEKSMLAAWVEFLKNPESEKVRTLETDIKAIKEAKDELVKISADKKQRAMYEMRQKTLHDEANALYSAEKKGIEKGKLEGKKEAKLELARNLLDILDEEIIALKTSLSIEEVKKLKEESIKKIIDN